MSEPLLSQMNSVFGWIASLSALLALIASAGSLWTSSKIDKLTATKISENNLAAAAAKKTAAEAAERAAIIELEAAELRNKASITESNFENLKKETAPRQLTPRQRSLFIASLQDRPASVMIFHLNSDEEARNFAEYLQSLFIESGWSSLIGTITPREPPPRGVLLVRGRIRRPGNNGDVDDAIEAAFADSEIENVKLWIAPVKDPAFVPDDEKFFADAANTGYGSIFISSRQRP